MVDRVLVLSENSMTTTKPGSRSFGIGGTASDSEVALVPYGVVLAFVSTEGATTSVVAIIPVNPTFNYH
ncbi:hypothetical protein ACLB2K_075136 [Fragaria x ananassa]